MNMDDIKHSMNKAFPVLNQGHYVNHAAISPWPTATARAVQAFAEENHQIGPVRYDRWLKNERQLRQGLQALTGAASPRDIALLKNTTDCICTVANGVHWKAGDNVVIPKGEFPSNRLPWLALQEQGVQLREVDIRATEDPVNALLSRMDSRTRLLSVSAVQWTDGLRLDLKRLGTACRPAGVLFFVDAIQILGALEVDVQDCQIDFLAADGHKWLLAPEGIAVFYSRHQLRQLQHGWHMTDNPYQFGRDEWPISETASRFEAGTPNMVGQAGFQASVRVLLDAGMHRVAASVMENSARLSAALQSMAGVELLKAFDPASSSGIVCFDVPAKSQDELLAALTARQVICTIRGGGIRLSPHFYQAGKPLEELLNVLEDVIISL